MIQKVAAAVSTFKALIVDDNPGIQDLFGQILAPNGYECVTASSGIEALQMALEQNPDLILLDVDLPGKDGFEVCRALRERGFSKPIVMMTGMPQDSIMRNGSINSGATDFLTKPVGQAQFLETVERLLLKAQGEPSLARIPEEPSDGPIDTRGILLIEDTATLSNLLGRFLQSKGHKVATEDKGAAGLLKAQAERPDLIILDLGLPDMDGIEVCARLKAETKTRPIPILILTGHESREDQLKAIESHADLYLTKPIRDFNEFYDWVRALLRRKVPEAHDVIRVGDFLLIDTAMHAASIGGRMITDLPDTQFRLLCEFARRPTEVLHRTYLVDRIWNNHVKDRTVDKEVCRLKDRMGPDAERWFHCTHGVGYRMLPESK